MAEAEEFFDMLARIGEMHETGLFMVLSYDPETKDYVAYGDPMDGPQAAIQAETLRANFDRNQLSDVAVKIAPWQPFDVAQVPLAKDDASHNGNERGYHTENNDGGTGNAATSALVAAQEAEAGYTFGEAAVRRQAAKRARKPASRREDT